MFAKIFMLCFTEILTKVRQSTEREVICLTLKKDPKLGLGKLALITGHRFVSGLALCPHCGLCPSGIVIVGEDAVGCYDLGIFIASIVPGGPADKDGRIQPGR